MPDIAFLKASTLHPRLCSEEVAFTGSQTATVWCCKMLDARFWILAIKMDDFLILSSIQQPVSSIGCYIGINLDREIIDNILSK